MVELDDEVAAVWATVAGGDAAWQANRILSFNMTRVAVLEEFQRTAATKREKAFRTILKNRTLHGGILAEGSCFIKLKYGEKRKGIGSRWYPKTLARRLINTPHTGPERLPVRQLTDR